MEERNELMEQETNQEVTEKTEESTPVVVEDNFGAGLIIGGTIVLAGGTVVKIVKNRKEIWNWFKGLFGGKKAEETDEPIDAEASEVESEDEEE